MKLFAVAAVLGLAIPAFSTGTKTYTVWYDTTYDQKENSLGSVACSNGLLTRGYHTFGDLPTYPFIGGAPQIQSYICGTCWEFVYTDANGDITIIPFIAINADSYGPEGFSISLEGMNDLTNSNTQNGVSVTAFQRVPSVCGL